MPSFSWLCACFFNHVPRGPISPGSDGCSPVRPSRSLAPPTSAATPNWKDHRGCEETRSLYFRRSWRVVSQLLLRGKLIVTDSILIFFFPRFDLSVLLMLLLSPDSLALRVAIGLFGPLGLPYSMATFPCPSLFVGRLLVPSRRVAPFLVPDRWTSR